MKSISELKEIYSNSVYNKNNGEISYNFPVPLFYMKIILYIIKSEYLIIMGGNTKFDISFNNDLPIFLDIPFSEGKKFVNIIITYDGNTEE